MQDIPDDPHRVLLQRYLEEGPVVRAYVRACLHRSHIGIGPGGTGPEPEDGGFHKGFHKGGMFH